MSLLKFYSSEFGFAWQCYSQDRTSKLLPNSEEDGTVF